MNVQTIPPAADTGALLAGAQFSDAFRVAVDGTALDARKALRDYLVTPLGLKTSDPNNRTTTDVIGIFPVLSQSPGRLVAGFDDSHLDFRVVVDVASSGPGQQVTATTLVLTHNRLGRIYLAIILPFHRLIVRSMLRQVAA